VAYIAQFAGISVDQESAAESQRIRAEQDRRQKEAIELKQQEKLCWLEAQADLLELEDIRSWAGTRLDQIHRGDEPVWPTEEEDCWRILQQVHDQMPAKAAAYYLVSHAQAVVRLRWVLHPEDRAALTQSALDAGSVEDERGHKFEIIL